MLSLTCWRTLAYLQSLVSDEICDYSEEQQTSAECLVGFVTSEET
jgi:hypothetical protein